MKKILAVLVAVSLLSAINSQAVPQEDDPASISNKIEQFLAKIDYKTGTIDLGHGLATLQVAPDTFRYVGPDDAANILLFWGNPPSDHKPLGMLLPAGTTPISKDSWVVVIQWTEDGHVKDDDAESIDYDKLLREMQESCREESKTRIKDGYESVELVGWATPPRYDKANHKMYWAKEIKFGDSPENELNYDIRMLGRHGVLVLNAISSTEQLKIIEAATPTLLSMVEFKEGVRYTDFDPAKDKYAAYGLAALVAGGVAAKAGLFKGLLVALIAAKKFIIIGCIALVAWVKKMFGRRTTAN